MFEELEIWQKSCVLSVRIYQVLEDCRDFGFKAQIQDRLFQLPVKFNGYQNRPKKKSPTS